MTLKQIQKMSGIDYSVLYQGLAYTGNLKRHRKNADYDVVTVLSACDEYCRYRVDKLYQRIREICFVRDLVEDSLEKAFTESPPGRL